MTIELIRTAKIEPVTYTLRASPQEIAKGVNAKTVRELIEAVGAAGMLEGIDMEGALQSAPDLLNGLLGAFGLDGALDLLAAGADAGEILDMAGGRDGLGAPDGLGDYLSNPWDAEPDLGGGDPMGGGSGLMQTTGSGTPNDPIRFFDEDDGRGSGQTGYDPETDTFWWGGMVDDGNGGLTREGRGDLSAFIDHMIEELENVGKDTPEDEGGKDPEPEPEPKPEPEPEPEPEPDPEDGDGGDDGDGDTDGEGEGPDDPDGDDSAMPVDPNVDGGGGGTLPEGTGTGPVGGDGCGGDEEGGHDNFVFPDRIDGLTGCDGDGEDGIVLIDTDLSGPGIDPYVNPGAGPVEQGGTIDPGHGLGGVMETGMMDAFVF